MDITPPSSIPSISPPPPVSSWSKPVPPEPPQPGKGKGKDGTGKRKRKADKPQTKAAAEPEPPKPRPKPEEMPPKPPFTYAQLCYRAIKDMDGRGSLQEIVHWMMRNYTWYDLNQGTGWEVRATCSRFIMHLAFLFGNRGRLTSLSRNQSDIISQAIAPSARLSGRREIAGRGITGLSSLRTKPCSRNRRHVRRSSRLRVILVWARRNPRTRHLLPLRPSPNRRSTPMSSQGL